MIDITAAIVSHNRETQLRNMIWQLENQIWGFKEIALYVSGYAEGQLKDLEKKYRVSYQRDMKDWGHDKRATAIRESRTRYILCASDDDIYAYHFTEALQRQMIENPDAQIYATDWRTQRERNDQNYGYHIAEPRSGGVTSGCMVVDAPFVNKHNCYKNRDFGADGALCLDVIKEGGRFVRVPYLLFFHY